MEQELKELKSVLRSLVVSSATEVDVRTLLHDYRSMVGRHLPITKYGHKEPVTFLKEYFSDCFLFQGQAGNPVLTLIVPDSLKHIDKFVKKQKVNNSKSKGKRRSVEKTAFKPNETNLITKTFAQFQITKNQNSPPLINGKIEKENISLHNTNFVAEKPQEPHIEIKENSTYTQTALNNFLKKRTPLFNSQLSVNDDDSSKEDGDSGRLSLSSSSSKRAYKEQLHREIKDIISENPDGVLCTDLLRLYRMRYNRELNFSRLGYTSVLSAVCDLDGVHAARHSLDDDWLLSDRAGAPPRAPAAPRRAAAAPRPPRADPDDALPGIDFEPDVFPADCMHFLENIPSVSLADVRPGDMLEASVAEVYSPSHFWMMRLGERHDVAVENVMDDMNEYYGRGEGRDRRLAPGALRVGHYCASLYCGDWHRSLIVRFEDEDTVKVRHVDYGTVERVRAADLRPLPRRYSSPAAQAVRARLAGVRPPAAGRRWPHASSHRFLRLVRDRRLVANVVTVHLEHHTLDVLLIDTSTSEDRSLAAELLRSGHADPSAELAASDPTSECYLYPRFEALEAGDTPSFVELDAYLRDGISLDCVHDYRRHVPPGLPPAPPPAPPAAGAGGVTLSAAQCETFATLSRVDVAAAHRFMMQAVSGALRPSRLDPAAADFTPAPARPRLPPGFDQH